MSDTMKPALPALTPRQLAEEVGIPEKMIRTMLENGLRHVRIGRRIYIRRAAFDEFFLEHETDSFAPAKVRPRAAAPSRSDPGQSGQAQELSSTLADLRGLGGASTEAGASGARS